MASAVCLAPASKKNWASLLWLVNLLWLPVDPILSHSPPIRWIEAVAATLVFLGLYLWSLYRLEPSHPARIPIIVIVYALGTWVMTFNIGASAILIFGAGMVGYSLPAHRAWPFLLGYCVSIPLISALVLHDNIFAWIMAFAFSSLVGINAIRDAEDARTNAKLQIAHDEVERMAKVAERERIARDVHDVLGHTLSLIVLKSELASKLAVRDPAKAASEIREVESIARGALRELREAITGYRSAGIAAEIDHARRVLEGAGLSVDALAEAVRLPPTHEGVLALAIREAVTNVVRHAGAHAVQLRLVQARGQCRFEIADDGRGSSNLLEGNGLGGMRERIEALGGTMLRDATSGTRLTLTLPTEARS